MKLADLKPGDHFLETRLSDPSIEYEVRDVHEHLDGSVTVLAARTDEPGHEVVPLIEFFDGDKGGCYSPLVQLVERGECDQ